MAVFKVKFLNSYMQLCSDEPEKTKELVASLNARMEKIKKQNSNLADLKLFFLVGLSLEEEIQKLNAQSDISLNSQILRIDEIAKDLDKI